MSVPASSAFPHIHLSPGKLLIASEPLLVVTVLGSCVAITFFERKYGLAAICHVMLPSPHPREQGTIKSDTYFRYMSFALPAMIDAYRLTGVDFETIEAKMFGGAAMLGNSGSISSGQTIGEINVEIARSLLRDAGISLCAENIGGAVGRKIIFNTFTGEVLHKQLSAPVP